MKTMKASFIMALITSMGVSSIQLVASHACDQSSVVKANELEEFHYAQEDNRYPQTIVHDAVINFLNQPLAEGKQTKKVLVLGYDGFREDALYNLGQSNHSAVVEVAKQGGLYHSYAGADGTQNTLTAPGWLSILSGEWAYRNQVLDNEGVKPAEVKTFLSEAITLGFTSAFLSSWANHFTTTYRLDVENLDNQVQYQFNQDDEVTISSLHKILQDTSDEAIDVVFSILEFSDHAGHAHGYGNEIPEYVNASMQADEFSYSLLEDIYARSTYAQEEWLIIITTDHGGIELHHGGQTKEERNTWISMNIPLDSLILNY